MARFNWKSIAASYAVVTAATLIPTMAHAWPGYKLYQIPGYSNLANAAYGVNSYNAICGSANFTANMSSFTGMLGGAGIFSSFYSLPSGWPSLQFNALNNSGIAIGTAYIGVHPTAVAFKPGSPIYNLQTGLTYTYQSIANGINNAGTVVGSYRREDPTGVHTHMFRWDLGTHSRTGDWLNLIPGGINEDGTMVAQNIFPTNYYQLPELWFVPATGPIVVKNAPGYFLTMQPNSVSTYGGVTVVGDMTRSLLNTSNSPRNAFVYNKSNNIWQLLQGVGGVSNETHALAVDVWGTRAAGYTVDASGNQTAVVWESVGGVWTATSIGSLLPADTTWQYNQATSISPLGAISGFGKHHEGEKWVQRAFVLTPSNQLTISAMEAGIFGGEIVNPNIHLGGKDPFTLVVGVMTRSPLLHLPGEVRIAPQQTDGMFTMDTQGVDTVTPVDVTANLGGVTFTRTFTLRPAILSTFTVQSGGGGGTGNVLLRGQAGPIGALIGLLSNNPEVKVPATMTIPHGQSNGQFKITVGKGVKVGTVVTITAKLGGASLNQTFTVR